MKILSVDTNTLNDLLHTIPYHTYDFWKSTIEKNYPSGIVVDHPLVKSFKFFTTWPNTLVFYVDSKTNRIICEALAVKSVYYSDKMHKEINFDRSVLLGVFAKSMDGTQDNLVVRYGTATHDILPYKFNE